MCMCMYVIIISSSILRHQNPGVWNHGFVKHSCDITIHAVQDFTPSPPIKSCPTKSPRVELSGRLPIKLYGHENSHPLELRVCLSQAL